MSSLALHLNSAISDILQGIVRSGLYGRAMIKRAHCVLLASQGLKFCELSKIVGLSAKTSGNWVKRFAQSLPAIQHAEQTQSKAALTRLVMDCLRDAPRSGRPKTFAPDQVASVISIACEKPEDSGRPVTSWTATELVSEAVLRNVVETISKSQVQRFLANVQLDPHKKKGWCFTTEKDQALFQQQAELVCKTYLESLQLFAERNIRTVCVDEMTSLQANERRAPTKRPVPGHCAKEECQYTRHGTVCLTGSWDVANGQFLLPTIEETRNNEDFAKHIERLIKTDMADGWVFVVDNLNTHCGEPLVRMIAQLLGTSEEELGAVRKRGILKNMASRRAYLTDPSHSIRFVYTPKHSSWLNQIEGIFGIINRRVIRGGSFTSKSDLIEKLKRFSTYFNENIAKPMKWTYTGRPTEKESLEKPKTWRELWPFRKFASLPPKTEGT